MLRATTGDGKLDIACRALLAFNRGDRARFAGYFEAEARGFAEHLGGERLDDARVLAETLETLVISAAPPQPARRATHEPLHLVIVLRGRKRVYRVVSHPTPEAAVASVPA